MRGWKTWTAVIGLVIAGIYEISEGHVEAGVERILAGLGLVGIGHKIEKTQA